MRYSLYIIFFIVIFFCGCSQNRSTTEIHNSCYNGNILFVYAGWNDKSIYPLLISTNEKDTSYYKFVNKKFDDYGFVISNLDNKYMRKEYIENKVYLSLKEYIVNNNTNKVEFITDRYYDRFKVVLFDSCDFVIYGFDSSDSTYINELIKEVGEVGNKGLLNEIESYKELLTNKIH